ncbi:hypothetical protein SAMN04489761_3165 [Tenacibaculum sp. MAR_2009_124]|uniref:hypothetical protein n=1 Tax=Tenacibaculum sp. MAR_2009_124 TaxID=1250059 RepID=UPI0008980B01|nr:hypothetical protein [Tenacibaculum sp. MAR_2009_124]SEC50098.1 hypothetical protein SAMN04489761_3165 [Tenacibaculum sp. MAR_2009_124]
MKTQILNLGKSLTKSEQKNIQGGVVPNSCFDNSPGYRAECREIALNEFKSGGCPTWNACFVGGPGNSCTDMCESEPGGR